MSPQRYAGLCVPVDSPSDTDTVTWADYAALQARIAELEARNAASERDAVLVPREATSKMMDRAVAAMHAAPVDWQGRQGHAAFRAGYAAALDEAIEAHAQGQE